MLATNIPLTWLVGLVRTLTYAALHSIRVRLAMFALPHTIVRARVPKPPVGLAAKVEVQP
jgi:hypothetical protein